MILLAFILGAIFGSFISVLVYRTQHQTKLGLLSRSICPACKTKISPHHLIPVISYLLLGGKCASCKKKIAAQYLMVEIFTGTLFALAYAQWSFLELGAEVTFLIPELALFVYHVIVFIFLSAIFFYDLAYKIIPDRFSIPAIVLAAAGGLLLQTVPPIEMLIGGVGIFLFFAAQFFISQGRWIGGGDLRLGALMGVLLGWKLGLLALVLSYFIGALVAIPLLLNKKANRKTQLPFGPFLIAGTLVALFHGQSILSWYLNGLLFYA